MSHALFNIG